MDRSESTCGGSGMNYSEFDTEIKSRYQPEDDGCDYTAVIIDRHNRTARARTGAACQPAVKPIKVSEVKPKPDSVRVGKRGTYNFAIMVSAYRLQLHFNKSMKEIADLLGLPLNAAKVILKRDTKRKVQAYNYAQTNRCDSVDDVITQLRRSV